jgi:LuxR family maltose regulon positive regulatory protein
MKLYVPKSRSGLVPRPRLSKRLDRGTASKLTLVSAPAGFGKTTLLTEWLAEGPAGERQVAWLSLDRADNDPASFWTYVIAALRTAAAGVGESALSLLQASSPPPTETVLTVLLNELGAIAADIVLVLDDYHVIDAPEVQDGMAFLLDHLPAGLHVVIASRADPALPLARLRARGELVETRAAELRFTPDEAAAYLNEMMGLELTSQDVAALEARTEGWIAALQLAALMAARPCWRRWTGGTCSWSRWMTAASGTATTICLPTCCRRACSTSSQARCLTCTGGRARGTSATASRPRPSATRWPPGISSGRRTWSSWRPRP